MIELHLDLTQEEAKVYSEHCKDQGHNVLVMTETLIRLFVQRAKLLKDQDKKVSAEAFNKIQHKKF